MQQLNNGNEGQSSLNIFQRNPKKVVLLSVFAASFSAIFVRLADAPAMAIGFYRLSFALPIFIIPTLLWHKEGLKSLTKKQFCGAALGGVLLAGHFFSWFTSIGYTSVASATVIGLSHPILILGLGAVILHEIPTKKAVAGVLVALLGAVIISWGDFSLSPRALFGDFMAFMGATFMALYFIVGRIFRKNIDALVYVTVVFFFCWVTFAVGMFATATPFAGYSLKTMLWIVAMAIVCQIGAHAVFNWCLGYVSPLYIGTWEAAEAVIASIIAVFLFSEFPTMWQYVGGVTVLLGLIWYNKHATE